MRLEECPVPDRLTKWQWIDVFRPNGIKGIIQTLKAHLGQGKMNNPNKKSQTHLPSKEDILDMMLFSKFQKRSFCRYGRLNSGVFAISDGAFLEFRGKIPKLLRDLRRDSKENQKLTDIHVARVIPPRKLYRKSKNVLTQIKPMANYNTDVLINARDIRCAVDRDYIHYILGKYPQAKLYITSPNGALVAEDGKNICCILMPMKPDSNDPKI